MGGKVSQNLEYVAQKETDRQEVDRAAQRAQRPAGLLISGKINKLTGNKLTKDIEWKS
jgi:hypothetical protein